MSDFGWTTVYFPHFAVKDLVVPRDEKQTPRFQRPKVVIVGEYRSSSCSGKQKNSIQLLRRLYTVYPILQNVSVMSKNFENENGFGK